MSNVIPLSQPDITESEIAAVVGTLRSGRLSIGPQADAFERLVAERAGRPFGVAVNSGTSGLFLSLIALGIGPGDEVITPAFSFVASANCVLHAGATPVFVDCDPRTLNMSLAEVERAFTPRTKAVIGVEVFGNPADMPELASLCARHEVPLVEDACEGLGGMLKGEPIGHFGRMAVFGFFPNKQITTGEGGMIVTHDDRLAALCRSLRNQGRPLQPEPSSGSPVPFESPGLGSWLEHERMGFNFRLPEINAALGVAQMRRLDQILDARQRVADGYFRRLGGNPDLILPTIPPDTLMSWFVYVIRLSDRYTAADRDEIIAGLRRHDIGASNYFPPIPLLPFYRRAYGYVPGDFPVAERVSERTIALPFHNRLTEREQDLICQTLEVMMQRMTFSRD
ncbi:MAG: DegT/DnrJ/EryC1/StrS family aminotransferase [Phycisphaerales bacterium]|nr:DegT/DnrJ/EryC1/StrS family aminotransferase [Phycisphaerales bacterium]